MMQGVCLKNDTRGINSGERGKEKESDEKEAGQSSNFQFLHLMGGGGLTIVPGKRLYDASLKVILFVLGFVFPGLPKKVISRFNQMF